ncbi:MAG: 23S rRNA (uracil(1939)-C(5))-methyltransferase RlmD [Defluviitaleaceae bacterium]|nr:23S rRNA (uracil(1939)-C(5))-methyltransferase RlmD [Defluviitaleaceae bacterium]MCL2274836.1 23S rRNA (uracil(1939)-C(5))-methyltransferase RlmD [Defluviitaleaceae bacterium]
MSNKCAHVGRCGGCTHYEISYEEELRLKEADLRETLGEYGAQLEGLRPSPVVEGYRNKFELAFGDDGGKGETRKLALGMRKKRSFYEVATTENCVLMPDDFKKIAAYTMQFFRESGEAVYHRKAHTGVLRHLLLRRGHFTGEILVLLSTTSALEANLAPFVQGLRDLPLRGVIVGILHAKNDGVADAIKNECVTTLWGRDFYREKLLGLTFHVSAFSFFQTNSVGAEVLYEIVREMASGDGQLCNLAFDLYCGTGTIAQIISPLFEKVMGIELIPEAIEAAQKNAQLNGIENCIFHAHDITKIATQKKTPLSGAPNVIIVDPPRDGLSPRALAKVAELAPAHIIYVACKPASLVRDLPTLVNAGYTPVRFTAADLFPRTPHIEAICLLTNTQ